MRVIFEPERGQRVPVHVWARSIGDEARRLLVRLASQPWVVSHVAAMADAHAAEGVAVGSVFATEATLVPSALGGDLGCGISAVRTSLDAHTLDRATLARLVAALGRAIPAGDATHRGRGVPVPDALLSPSLSTHALEHTRAALVPRHLCTLGGGNHFLELDRDPDNAVWLLVHSGSRGLGAAIAAHHTRVPHTPEGSNLGGLQIDSPGGHAYLTDHAWALSFARANRDALTTRALEVLADELGVAVDPSIPIDVHHNHVARERWRGRDLWVHRKGAIAIPTGAMALVPGSMATASYLVEGLGNDESFGSCSHGAGRVLTRGEARRRLSVADLSLAMRHVAYPEHLARHLVEEAPAVYRDIGAVLDDQRDLVRRRVRLEPVAVLKG